MFCKYCGKPIDEGTMRCRICGRPVGPLEGGSGFWDLTEEAPASSPAAPADSKELRELRGQVQRLRKELETQPAQKKNALAAGAALLALLALAVALLALFQLWSLAGKLESLTGQADAAVTQPGEKEQTRPDAAVADGVAGSVSGGEIAGEETGPGEYGNAPSELPRFFSPVEEGMAQRYELDGVTYILWPAYFDGPRPSDDRGQTINRRDPEIQQTDVINIFNATFLGQSSSEPAADPGEYELFWARIQRDADGSLTAVEPLVLDTGRFVDAADASKRHSLSIIGGAEDGEEGLYAFVAKKKNAPYAYVSEIIELYVPEQNP